MAEIVTSKAQDREQVNLEVKTMPKVERRESALEEIMRMRKENVWSEEFKTKLEAKLGEPLYDPVKGELPPANSRQSFSATEIQVNQLIVLLDTTREKIEKLEQDRIKAGKDTGKEREAAKDECLQELARIFSNCTPEQAAEIRLEYSRKVQGTSLPGFEMTNLTNLERLDDDLRVILEQGTNKRRNFDLLIEASKNVQGVTADKAAGRINELVVSSRTGVFGGAEDRQRNIDEVMRILRVIDPKEYKKVKDIFENKYMNSSRSLSDKDNSMESLLKKSMDTSKTAETIFTAAASALALYGGHRVVRSILDNRDGERAKTRPGGMWAGTKRAAPWLAIGGGVGLLTQQYFSGQGFGWGSQSQDVTENHKRLNTELERLTGKRHSGEHELAEQVENILANKTSTQDKSRDIIGLLKDQKPEDKIKVFGVATKNNEPLLKEILTKLDRKQASEIIASALAGEQSYIEMQNLTGKDFNQVMEFIDKQGRQPDRLILMFAAYDLKHGKDFYDHMLEHARFTPDQKKLVIMKKEGTLDWLNNNIATLRNDPEQLLNSIVQMEAEIQNLEIEDKNVFDLKLAFSYLMAKSKSEEPWLEEVKKNGSEELAIAWQQWLAGPQPSVTTVEEVKK